MGKAVDTVEDLLSTDTASAVRLGAARTMAEIALHQHDRATILRTLDQIEQRQQIAAVPRHCSSLARS